MKILVLGASGLLGHEVFREANRRDWQVWGTCSQAPEERMDKFPIFKQTFVKQLDRLSVFNVFAPAKEGNWQVCVPQGICQGQFDVVVNAIGIVKALVNNVSDCVAVNSLFPQLLSKACGKNTYLIHISTDCVFNGKRGNYTEDDVPTAEDIYGKTKALGEIRCSGQLTLRTSFIGEELIHPTGLLDWFLNAQGKIHGFQRAIWTGFTAPILAKLICDLALQQPEGLYHIGCEAISKYDLLVKLKTHFKRENLEIELDNSVVCDRSLCSERFGREVNIRIPSIDEMIAEL